MKYTPTPISLPLTNSLVTGVNSNLERISAALENTLSRNGQAPNQMQSDLDMNHQDILNTKDVHADRLFLEGKQVIEVSEFSPGNFATAAQGAKADTALQPGDAQTPLDDLALQDLRQGVYETALRPIPERWRFPRILVDDEKYHQAPFTFIIGEIIFCCYSEGGTHGDTDRQILARKIGLRGAWEKSVFRENSTGAFDFSLLEPVMTTGQIITIKGWQIVKREDGCHAIYDPFCVQYTNSILYSDDTETGWALANIDAFGGGSIANTTEVRAPDGAFTANFIRPTVGTSARTISQAIAGFSPNQDIVFARKFKYKEGGPQFIRLFAQDLNAGGNSISHSFDIKNGVLGAGAVAGNGSNVSAAIIPDGNGWYTCVLMGKPNTSGTNIFVFERATTTATGNSYAADGIGGYYQWRGLLVAGVVLPTQTYLKTTTAAVSSGVQAGRQYAFWSRARFLAGSYYRTGYATVGSDTVAALFKSPDQYQWQLIATWATAGLKFSEVDIEALDNGNFVAVLREDSRDGNNNAKRDLYFSISTGGDSSWSVPALIPSMKGAQPNLNKMSDGRVVVAVGKRTVYVGLNEDGSVNYVPAQADRVGSGLGVAPSTWNDAADLSFVGNLGYSRNTDCGQPMGEMEVDGSFTYVMYLTKDSQPGTEPGVYSCNVQMAQI